VITGSTAGFPDSGRALPDPSDRPTLTHAYLRYLARRANAVRDALDDRHPLAVDDHQTMSNLWQQLTTAQITLAREVDPHLFGDVARNRNPGRGGPTHAVAPRLHDALLKTITETPLRAWHDEELHTVHTATIQALAVASLSDGDTLAAAPSRN
jgi:hypothetical protein